MHVDIGDSGSANPPELKLTANSGASGDALLIQRQGQTTPSVTLKYDGTAQFTGSFSAVRERTNVQAVIQAVGAGGARTAYLRLDGENSGSGNSEAIALFLNDSKQAFIRHTPNTPNTCLLYTSPSPRDRTRSRMPSSA